MALELCKTLVARFPLFQPVPNTLRHGPAADCSRLVKLAASDFKLVETLAEAVARIVVTEFAAAWVKISVTKPGAIPRARDVGIVIERQRSDYA